jgi:hypothetical protein
MCETTRRTPEELAAAVGEAFRCELAEPERPGGAWELTVVQAATSGRVDLDRGSPV